MRVAVASTREISSRFGYDVAAAARSVVEDRKPVSAARIAGCQPAIQVTHGATVSATRVPPGSSALLTTAADAVGVEVHEQALGEDEPWEVVGNPRPPGGVGDGRGDRRDVLVVVVELAAQLDDRLLVDVEPPHARAGVEAQDAAVEAAPEVQDDGLVVPVEEGAGGVVDQLRAGADQRGVAVDGGALIRGLIDAVEQISAANRSPRIGCGDAASRACMASVQSIVCCSWRRCTVISGEFLGGGGDTHSRNRVAATRLRRR